MENNQFIQELKKKLEESIQEGAKHKERIEYHRSELDRLVDLVDSINGVMRGLGVDTTSLATQEEQGIVSLVREPRDLKKPEFSKKGYITFTIEDLLPKYPQGASIDELISDGFDYNTEEEFEKIKKSYAVELNRAFREERIYKDESENFFSMENKPSSQDSFSNNTVGAN